MKHRTADPVLKKTFAHLDEILHEKNKQMEKVSRQTKKTVAPPQRAKEKTESKPCGELCCEMAQSD